jgi:hypothetical protein
MQLLVVATHKEKIFINVLAKVTRVSDVAHGQVSFFFFPIFKA